MLHNLISIVATTSLVIHALFGCCVHHSHSWKTHQHSADRGTIESNPFPVHRCPCGHHSSTSSSGENDGEKDGGEHKRCDEPNCSFVSDQRVADMTSMSPDVTWLFGTRDVDDIATKGSLLCRIQADALPGHLQEQGLLRALHQVWQF